MKASKACIEIKETHRTNVSLLTLGDVALIMDKIYDIFVPDIQVIPGHLRIFHIGTN